jgi:hypothetical protein
MKANKEINIAQMIEERFNDANDEVKEIVIAYCNTPEIQKIDYMVNLIKDIDEYPEIEEEVEALDILFLIDFNTYAFARHLVWQEYEEEHH